MKKHDRVTFAGGSAFFADVRARVDAYFASTGKRKTADAAMRIKTAFWLTLAAALFVVVVTGVLAFPLSLVAWAALGFTLACIGFNVGHDAIHGSYSKHDWINKALSHTFDVMGASSDTWKIAHNQIHHSYTNIKGVDADLEPGPTLRFYPHPEPPKAFHRFQHVYAWPLYGFVGAIWVFLKDFAQLREYRASRKVVARTVAWKLVHLALFVGLPLALGAPVLAVLAGYAVLLASAGLTLAVVFQLAHVVEGVAFPEAPDRGAMDTPWAENELRTTADFGRSRLTTFITGGLDHQIEHHLFPRVCHTHYRDIASIVEACARDHGLPYLHSGSFLEAVASHTRLLRTLGAPVAEPVEAIEPVEPLEAARAA